MCWSECSKIGCSVGAVGAINSQFTGLGKHDANKVKFNYLSHTKDQRGLCWESSSLWITDESSCAAAADVGLVALNLWTPHKNWNDALHSGVRSTAAGVWTLLWHKCLFQSKIYTFGSLSWPWALGLEISQELLFEGYFRFSLPDPENILQSGSKQWLRARFAIFYFPLGGEEICFPSVVWELSQWVVSTPPTPSGAVSAQDGAGQEHEALSELK